MHNLVSPVVEKGERIVLGELAYHLRVSRKIENVSVLQYEVWSHELLVYGSHESVVTGAAPQLQHIYSVFAPYVKLYHGLSCC